jgi:MFS family permease
MTTQPLIRRFLLARFLSTLADQFLLFAVPLIIFKATGSAKLSGLAFAIEWLPRVVSLPLAGLLADQLGSRRIFLLADSFRAVACLAGFGWIAWAGSSHLFLALSLMSAAVAFFYAQGFIALEASLPRVFPVGDLPKVQSWLQGIEQVSSIGGPLVSSFLVIWVKSENLILIAALLFSVSFLANLGLPSLNSSTSPNLKKSISADFKVAWGHIVGLPGLKMLIAYTVLVNLMYGLARALSVPMTAGTFGLSDHYYGVLIASSGGVTLLFLSFVPWLVKKMPFRWFGFGAFSLLAFSSFTSAIPVFSVFALSFAILHGADALFNVYIRTQRAKVIPREDMGKTIGFIVCMNQLSVPLSGLFIAFWPKTLGSQNLILFVSTIAVGLSALIWFFSSRRSESGSSASIAGQSA